jgi:hypothetical protein
MLIFFSSSSIAAQLPDDIKIIQDKITKCSGDYYGAQILNNLRNTGGQMYEDLSLCKQNTSNFIKEHQKNFLKEMGKKKLTALAKDFIIQSLSTLDAIGNEELFNNELSKLKSTVSRIDLELSTE